jgi:hypothetical protein
MPVPSVFVLWLLEQLAFWITPHLFHSKNKMLMSIDGSKPTNKVEISTGDLIIIGHLDFGE